MPCTALPQALSLAMSFPEATPVMALLSSFAAYSVGFIARPIGALLFGWIGDKHGRKIVMVITIGLMGMSTMLIGLIPSYAQIGVWAPVCLVILRFSQGLGLARSFQAVL